MSQCVCHLAGVMFK
uniref:Uncharacterized protein n=1 Tax=Rhizophora mucronata TaxID=61149 RepID=A0A2P2MYN1_RHIMU